MLKMRLLISATILLINYIFRLKNMRLRFKILLLFILIIVITFKNIVHVLVIAHWFFLAGFPCDGCAWWRDTIFPNQVQCW